MADTLTLLSAILLDLYDSSAPADGNAFRLWALERLQMSLPFTNAAWGFGALTASGLVLHHISLLGFPPSFADVIRATATTDPTAAKMLRAPGQSFIHSRADYPAEIVQLAAEPNDLRSSVEGIIVDAHSRLFCAVSLFRNRSFAAFNENDRALHQALLPHWLKAPSRRLVASAASSAEPGETVAVADLDGVFEAVSTPFIALLQREWPEWSGAGRLPAAIVDSLADARLQAGAHIAWRVATVGNRLIVRARTSRGADKLGEREREIARLLGEGLTLNDVATRLRLAPSTVRNHRDNIYHKLGVSNRLALLEAIRDAEGMP